MSDKAAKLQFIMLIGLPGSGKSTYVGKYPKHDNTVVLSTDGYIEEKAKELGKTYNEIFRDYIDESTKIFNENIKFAVVERKHIIIDQTNLSEKSRRRKLSQIPKHYAKFAIFWEPDIDRVWKVNQERHSFGRSLSDPTLQQMIDNFVFPTEEEGFDIVIKLSKSAQ
ncbi:MAG: ATP-binding protein [Nanoarchaeota archaeon]